ncbi:hypothetical protein pb186bvf_007890 [Paramecium bursaria]
MRKNYKFLPNILKICLQEKINGAYVVKYIYLTYIYQQSKVYQSMAQEKEQQQKKEEENKSTMKQMIMKLNPMKFLKKEFSKTTLIIQIDIEKILQNRCSQFNNYILSHILRHYSNR